MWKEFYLKTMLTNKAQTSGGHDAFINNTSNELPWTSSLATLRNLINDPARHVAFFTQHRDAINVRSELKENIPTSGVMKKTLSERNGYRQPAQWAVVSRAGIMNTSFVKDVTDALCACAYGDVTCAPRPITPHRRTMIRKSSFS